MLHRPLRWIIPHSCATALQPSSPTPSHLVSAKALSNAVWRAILIRVVLVRTLALNVVLIVHPLSTPSSIVFGAFAIPHVLTLGLSELVDFRTSQAGKHLFRELMLNGLAYGKWVVSDLIPS